MKELQEKRVEFYTRREQDLILKSISNQKHRLIVMFMMLAGLRVSETVNLKLSDFDFKKKNLNVLTLKKRKPEIRVVPLHNSIYLELADYLSKNKINQLLFPSPTNSETSVTRQSVNKFLNRYNNKSLNINKINPHKFRHTFATNLIASDTQLTQIQQLLGHSSLNTTSIYTHFTDEQLRLSIEKSTAKKGVYNRIKNLFKSKKQKLINVRTIDNTHFIGRAQQIKEIQELVNKDINVIVTGKTGVGKTAILDNISTAKKIIKVEDTTLIKQTLINILLYLYRGDKEAVKQLLFPELSETEIKIKINKQSTKHISNEIVNLCKTKEYILYINNIDDISKSAKKVIENLKDTFVIVTSSRQIKIDDSSFLWNFERIEIDELTRQEALTLISVESNSYNLEISDYETFTSHILEQSLKNPRIIKEMIFRYSKEFIIDTATIRSITHTGALKEIDMTMFFVTLIAALAVFRYLSAEMDNTSLRFIGGASMILLLFASRFFSFTKRKYM